MIQTIKPNDLVYIPHLSTCLHKVKLCSNSILCVDYAGEQFSFLSSGKLDPDDVTPLVYLATPENKHKLEEFYDIVLEEIPVDENLEEFIAGLNELSNFYARLVSSDGNFRAADKLEELKQIKSKLIQMFKERGEE